MCVDSLIVINSLSLATFPVYGNAMNKGEAAILKLFVTVSVKTRLVCTSMRIEKIEI